MNIKTLKVGDLILGKRLNRKVTGIITKIHPGSVVIRNSKNEEELIVVDSDKIFKKLKKR